MIYKIDTSSFEKKFYCKDYEHDSILLSRQIPFFFCLTLGDLIDTFIKFISEKLNLHQITFRDNIILHSKLNVYNT